MKYLQKILISIIIVFISSCSPKISTNINNSYSPLDYKKEVIVLGTSQEVPKNAEVLGQIKIGDTGFSINCDYDNVINKAKIEARKVGGNAIKIIRHKTPSPFVSTCHRITVRILKIDNITFKEENEIILDVDYAILNIYRYGGAIVGYDLHLGDSVLCRVRNNFKTTLHIKKEGLNTLWAKTESKYEVPINIEKGKTYYLRCSLKMGVFVGRPKLVLVDRKSGKVEFDSFKAKHQ